jgi:hypothetical protein
MKKDINIFLIDKMGYNVIDYSKIFKTNEINILFQNELERQKFLCFPNYHDINIFLEERIFYL